MKIPRIEWLINTLIVSTWLLSWVNNLAPEDTTIYPFFFSDAGLRYTWYIYEIGNEVTFIILIVCLLIKPKKVHWITKDIITVTLILAIFSILWFQLFYNNPFYESYFIVKSIIAVIYFSVISIRYGGNTTKSRHRINSVDNNNDVHSHY